MGVLFGYYVIAPLSINFLGSYSVSSEVQNIFTIDSFISIITMLTIAAGVVFQLPIVVYFLSKVGILTPAFMRAYRKHAIVVILIIAAVITPSPDVTSQLLVAFPLLLLGFVIFSMWSGASAVPKLQKDQAQRAEEARLYPKQTFVREVPGGADTLIVFPDRMVASRKYDGLKYPLGGLLGYLNEERTHIQLDTKPDPVIRREELSQFTDAGGRRFSDSFPVQE